MTILCFSPSLTFTNSLVVAFISSKIGGKNQFDLKAMSEQLYCSSNLMLMSCHDFDTASVMAYGMGKHFYVAAVR